MAISPAVDQDPGVSTTTYGPDGKLTREPGGSPRSAPLRLVLLGVLVLALLVSAGVLVWLLADRRGEAEDLQAEREKVMSQTEQFVLRLNTYGPDQLDDQGHLPAYQKQVADVITPKFASDFEKSGLPIAEQTVAQAGYGRDAEVFGVGVESIDDDSATVIVAAGFTSSYPDPKHADDASRRIEADASVLRWAVQLVKTDGTWLVDDYALATGEDSP
jgi:Mce-associated membrane protein